MSDHQQAAGQDAGQQPVFNLQRIFLKDASLEIPMGPAVFLDQNSPKLEFDLDTSATELQPGLYESTIRCTVTCSLGDKTAFLVEGTQSGIFEITGVPAEQLDLLLGISCPHILYPYIRANLADLIQRASLPPLHLAEINWEAYYRQRQQRLAEQQAAEAPSIVLQ